MCKNPGFRPCSGNILAIAAITGVIILVIALWAIDVFWLHFLSGKEMSAAEKVAMAAAVALNKNDNVGQMNFTLAHSRELVICTRYDEALCEAVNPEILPLARAISQRARDSATLLAQERNKLQRIRMDEAVEAAQKAVSSAGSPGDAHMAGVATSAVSINKEQSCFGCLSREATGSADPHSNVDPKNVATSNVEPSNYLVLERGGDAMADYDKQFVDSASKFYKGNCMLGMNPPFGGDDTDLEINIASLPPCINGYTAPPRLIQAKEFQFVAPLATGLQPQFMPSAVYVVLQLDVKDTQSGATHSLMAPGVAVTGGAGPQP